jgi:hypothetical protein
VRQMGQLREKDQILSWSAYCGREKGFGGGHVVESKKV